MILHRVFVVYLIIFTFFAFAIDGKQARLNRLNYLKIYDAYLYDYLNGQEYFRRADLRHAIRYYEEISKYMPHSPLPFGNIAACYFFLRNWADAGVFYQKAITLFPGFYAFYQDAGMVRFIQNDFQKAKEYFEKSLKLLKSVQFNEVIQEYGIIANAQEKDVVPRRSQRFVDQFQDEDRKKINSYLIMTHVCLGQYPEMLAPTQIKQMRTICISDESRRIEILKSFKPHIYRIAPVGNKS